MTETGRQREEEEEKWEKGKRERKVREGIVGVRKEGEQKVGKGTVEEG